MEEREVHTKLRLSDRKERDHFGDQELVGKIILKLIV